MSFGGLKGALEMQEENSQDIEKMYSDILTEILKDKQVDTVPETLDDLKIID